jgi:hypothetical protein
VSTKPKTIPARHRDPGRQEALAIKDALYEENEELAKTITDFEYGSYPRLFGIASFVSWAWSGLTPCSILAFLLLCSTPCDHCQTQRWQSSQTHSSIGYISKGT